MDKNNLIQIRFWKEKISQIKNEINVSSKRGKRILKKNEFFQFFLIQ